MKAADQEHAAERITAVRFSNDEEEYGCHIHWKGMRYYS